MDGLTRRVPDGYTAVELLPTEGRSALRVCVLCRNEPDPVGGRFVVVRDVLDASVFLGCVQDAAGDITQWIEVWVQRVEGLRDSAGRASRALDNASLEARWKRTASALSQIGGMIHTGFEETNPPAVGIDTEKGVSARPMHEPTGTYWDVCRDEDILAAQGLASYRSSLERYLWVPELGGESPFLPLSDRDAVREGVLTGVNRHMVPFNLGGGLMMVCPLAPIAYADQVEIIAGRSWSGVPHGVASIDLREGDGVSVRGGGFVGDPEPIDPDRLFLGRHGRWGRLVESLHLKLKLLAEAVNTTRIAVERMGRPLLNITDESFRVEIWEGGLGLPRLWTSRVRLVDPGTAHGITVGGQRLFISPDGLGHGVYRPEIGGGMVRGRCDVRIRGVEDTGDGAVVEATIRTDERVPIGGSDLIEIQFSADDRRVLLHGRLLADDRLGPGEARFRSVPVGVEDAGVMRSAEGVPIRDASLEVIVSASTPCDLHALGVLGVRTLLVDGENTLAAALDDLASLARCAQQERESDGSISLEDSFERAFFADAGWAGSIGPGRLIAEVVPAAQALDLVPSEVWVRVLALLSRMLLGVSDAGFCRDAGDTRGLAPHLVFDGALRGLTDLLVRTRSLIVVDWRHNREVHSVVRSFREGMSGGAESVGID